MATPQHHLPTTDALQAALEAQEEAREAFIGACYTFRETLALSALATTKAAWQAAAEPANALAAAASAAVEAYLEERAERFCASERGQALEQWAHDLQHMQVDPEPAESLWVHSDFSGESPDVDIEDPDDILPETPEVPELDWYE
jgi:hypothetical protein